MHMNSATAAIDPTLFRAYDIRGIVDKSLTPAAVYRIGRAIASAARACGDTAVVIARDGRLSGPALSAALAQGLQDSGAAVTDIGCVPTPVLYFATHHLHIATGVMLTGSHNPPDYNGLKIVLCGDALAGDELQALYQRIVRDDFSPGTGHYQTSAVDDAYVERIRADVHLRQPCKVVVDCGNGAAGEIAPRVLRALGCEVIPLYCAIDGRFPNHHPDPSRPENMVVLQETVRREHADIGFAFDGDGDRLGVVDNAGAIIWPDRVLMPLAQDIARRHAGAEILYDVKCTRHLASVIRQAGGVPVMWKTGHSLIKAKIKACGALLAGEMSGHIFFKERWYGFDDAVYTAARLLEVVGQADTDVAQLFAALPDSVNTPELNIRMAEGEHHRFMQGLQGIDSLDGAVLCTLDGLRADFADGFGLVRASNTTPCLVLRFEGDNEAALQRIQARFKRLLHGVDPDLSLPF